MNDSIENLLYDAGLTAQGCWDELDAYAQEAIIRVIKLTVKECMKEIHQKSFELLDIDFYPHYQERLKKHFGVQE